MAAGLHYLSDSLRKAGIDLLFQCSHSFSLTTDSVLAKLNKFIITESHAE
jgi:hypothetical protein